MCTFTISPAGSFGSIQKLSSPAAADFPDQFRQNTVQVTDNSVVGNIEDQGSWICVDRDNTGRVPHADYMLYRSGDAAVDIEAGGNCLPALSDQLAVGNPSLVHSDSRSAYRPVQQVCQLLYQRKSFRTCPVPPCPLPESALHIL